MIKDALTLVLSQLNDYIHQQLASMNSSTPIVVLNSITDGSGTTVSGKDLVTITLANVEEECINKAQQFQRNRNNSTYSYVQPEIRLNLLLLLSIRPDTTPESYNDALTKLTYVSQFFQLHPYLDQSSIRHPQVSDSLERLNITLVSPTFEQQSYIWGVHGGTYLPSLLYRVSLVTIQGAVLDREVTSVSDISISADSGGL